MNEAYIYTALRTPRGKGKSKGSLYEVRPIDLLSTLLAAMRERHNLDTGMVDDVLIGCVTPIDDQGGNIARAALLHAGWDERVGGMQINRYCASGLEAVNLAAVKIRSGWESLVVAGGVESMSRVPLGADGGPLLQDPEVISNVKYVPQGISADLLATLERFDRHQLDDYALLSQQRAAEALEKGFFRQAVVPIHDRNGLLLLEDDECLRPETTAGDLAALPSAFAETGRQGFDAMALQKYPFLENITHDHTAGNSSAIVDGAALVLLGSRDIGDQIGMKPRAYIRSVANISVEPTLMLTGPAPAARLALQRAGMQAKDIDLWECNEAFSAVALKFQREMEIEPEQLNVNGGAIALGHPLGATGAMLLGTLLDELERRDLQTGLVTLCVGGGMGVAAILERV